MSKVKVTKGSAQVRALQGGLKTAKLVKRRNVGGKGRKEHTYEWLNLALRPGATNGIQSTSRAVPRGHIQEVQLRLRGCAFAL